MKAIPELGPRPNQNVRSSRYTPANLVGQTTSAPVQRRVVGNDDQQVVVAVRSGLAAGVRAEKVDALRPIGLHQAADDLAELRIDDARPCGRLIGVV